MTDTETIHRFVEQNMLVEKYLLGELSGPDLEDFEQHIFECSICLDKVEDGERFKAGIVLDGSDERKSFWQRIKGIWGRHVSRRPTLMIAAICCGAPLPPDARPNWFSLSMGIFMAGLLIGVMLMAVLQHYAKSQARRKKRRVKTESSAKQWQEFERLGNSIGGAIPPRRWNGRYPADRAPRRS